MTGDHFLILTLLTKHTKINYSVLGQVLSNYEIKAAIVPILKQLVKCIHIIKTRTFVTNSVTIINHSTHISSNVNTSTRLPGVHKSKEKK